MAESKTVKRSKRFMFTMNESRRRLTVGIWGVVLVLATSFLAAGEEVGRWVTTWGCGIQLTEPWNLPPVSLRGTTLRQFVYTTLSGKRLRLRLSNEYGTNIVKLTEVHIALASGRGSAGDGEIDPNTDRMLKFGGSPSVVIPPGGQVVSDPVEFDLPPLTNLAISMVFEDVPDGTITGHPGSRTTSFIQKGNLVSAKTMPEAVRVQRWYFIAAVDVLRNEGGVVVTLGDSLTDGRGSTTDANNRWPDVLARRLHSNPSTEKVGVVNMGIGGNAVLSGGLGPTARSRFKRDVLGVQGVRWLIIYEGVNDIGGAGSSHALTVASNLINAYIEFAKMARENGVRPYIATLTPFKGHSYYTPEREEARQFVNMWIRTNTVYEAAIDFDAAVRDPADPSRLASEFDSGDHLHLSPEGYHKLGQVIDLRLFEN